MRPVCTRLLKDTLGESTPSCEHEKEYQRLVNFSSQYPQVEIKVEDTVMMIEKQWITIARIIVNQKRKDLVIPTLFAATKQLMEVYSKVDPEIPRYHALWLNAVLDELERREKSSLFYFLIITAFIFYISI